MESNQVGNQNWNQFVNQFGNNDGKIYISYCRVSTNKQGVSGLGLEAQQSMVRKYIGREPDFEYIEIETGTRKRKMPELIKALDKAKEVGVNAKLVISTISRLSRNLHFVTGLQESKVDFVCCDSPNASILLIQIQAAFAQEESRLVSERTKAAFESKRKREIESGNTDFVHGRSGGQKTWEKAREKGVGVGFCVPKLDTVVEGDNFKVVEPVIRAMIDRGKNDNEIANKLTDMNRNYGFAFYPTFTGLSKWTPVQVIRFKEKIKYVDKKRQAV